MSRKNTKNNSPKLTKVRTKSGGTRSVLFKVLFIVAVTTIVISAESYFALETKVSDLLINFNRPPDANHQVVIVGIDDDDFEHLFRATSPLDPQRVMEVVDAISLGEPRCLGVDILTSDNPPTSYPVPRSSFPIVWASSTEKSEDETVLLRVLPPLGGAPLALNNSAGMPESLKESGIHRIYERELMIGGSPYPSFPWQIYLSSLPADAISKTDLSGAHYIRFSNSAQDYRRIVFTSQILAAAKAGDFDELKYFFKDKIVVLGAMYHDSRDIKTVPRGIFSEGDIFGVELMATAIETELGGSPLKPIPTWLKLLLNIIMVVGFSMIFIHYGVTIRSLGLALVASIVVAITISILQYYSFSGFPLLMSIMLYGIAIALFDLVIDKYKRDLYGVALALRSRTVVASKKKRGARRKRKK